VLPILSPLDRPVVRVTVREPCPDPEVICPPDSPKPFVDAISLPPQIPGRHEVELQLAQRSGIDSTAMQLYSKVFAYVVKDSCGPPPPPRACVWPFLEPRRQVTPVPPSGPCDLRLLPGGTGSLVFTARAEDVPLAGLQGQFGASDFLRIENLELVGPAAGMHLNWVHKNNGAAFVMFSDLGAPIPAGDWVSVLRVTVSAARPTTGTTMGEVYGSVTAASDSFGTSVGICPIMTLVMPAAHVCIGGPASCDANGDGVSNVADLVRMVLCMLRPWDCPDTLAARPDCTNDGEFHLDDLFCCARGMLGIPHDSSGVGPGDLSFTFGTPRMDGNILHVPLQVRGADRMGGALLRIDYPSDRWIAVDPTLTGPSSGPSWTPLLEVGSDDVLVGLLRLDTTAPGELSVPLDFRLRPGAQPGGQIRIGSSEISAADGTPIDLDLSSLVATLEPGSGSAPTHVALSPARPNPATGATSFAVSLPVAGEVDLAIYDLAGRRVATLWHGSLAAGNRSFTWQPEGVPSGMYFARLSVNGEVRSSRVALKLGR
jgi:hypothetical protein